jgi:UDP-3-O-[3-hydroxymyristoyl] glucosamine N-acyltransferase
MRFIAPVPITWIAELIGASVRGNVQGMATGINEIHKVEPGDIAFVDHPKYYRKCIDSQATFIIINQEAEFPDGKALLLVDEPFEAYLKIVRHFRPFEPASGPLSPSAVIGAGTYVYPGVFIGNHVRIGDGCVLHPGVCIMDHCEIGDRVVIQAGTVIGSEPFYYNTRKDRDVWYRRMESCGRVIIGDDVEIGAGCTIDRGVTSDTVIGRGTKMDNMVHIGHDTVVGRNCLFAAQVGVAGAVNIEDGVILWGQVGVSKTLTIGKNAVVFAQSGVPSNLEAGKTYWGTPVLEASEKKRELVWVKRIAKLWERVGRLDQE